MRAFVYCVWKRNSCQNIMTLINIRLRILHDMAICSQTTEENLQQKKDVCFDIIIKFDYY